MFNGMLNVYKEEGYTSHDVVAKLRGILHQKKIGHTGTLDPGAVGVLPVCLGKGTRLCELLADKDKTYIATARLGVETDTQDMSGKVLNTSNKHIVKEELEAAIASFLGDYEQIPPMYSALKVHGRKLYELAREGLTVERKPRTVQIYSITLLEFDGENQSFTMEVQCSKGTYIRTLCHDIGQKLGCGGAMEKLIRTRVSGFSIDDALTLEQIAVLAENQQIEQHIISIEDMLPGIPAIAVSEHACKWLYNGNILKKSDIDNKRYDFGKVFSSDDDMDVKVYDNQNRFIALYHRQNNIFKPVKMFYSLQDFME